LAIEAGKHVLVEKPIAVDVSEAQQMVEASSRANVFVMPGHIMRFDPRYALVKQEIEDGKLGEVATIYARRNVSRRFDLPMAERAHPAFRTGVHDIDIALWYIGDHVVHVYALERSIQGKNYPDILWALLEFANGAIVCLESNWIVPRGAGLRSETLTEVNGTQGAARIRPPTDSLLLSYDQDRFSPNTVWWPTVHGSVGGALRNELAYFVKCVTEGTRPSVVTMEEALQSIRVAAAIVQSAQSGKEVCL
jgi:predicted dehydrogenase